MKELYISVDVETAGPIPAEYSMLSLGACLVNDINKTFYVELKPINSNYIAEALDVCGLSMEYLIEFGTDPLTAMQAFNDWIAALKGRPVFVGFNTPFDWSFVNYYFIKYLGNNPFGHNALDLKAYYMGLMRCRWSQTVKGKIPARFKSKLPHTHNALQDAQEQAGLFANLLKYKPILKRRILVKPRKR